jgi:hypothetical protein
MRSQFVALFDGQEFVKKCYCCCRVATTTFALGKAGKADVDDGADAQLQYPRVRGLMQGDIHTHTHADT